MDEYRKFMEKFKEDMDERLIKPKQKCGICNKDLQMNKEDILFYSKTTNEWLCYNCYSNVLMDEDIIFFLYREDGMAEMIRTRPLPSGGPFAVKKPSIDISIATSKHSNKCEHIDQHCDDLNVIFRCQDCGKWICASCLNEHKGHSITGNGKLKKSEEMIQVLPYLYEPIIHENDLKVDFNLPKKVYLGKKFPIQLKIQNNGDEQIYDLKISFGLHSSILDPSTGHDYYEKAYIETLKSIKPKAVEELDLKIGLTNLSIYSPKETTVIIDISCRDFFDGRMSKELKTDLIIDKIS